eukprot:1742173-Prymnesium_polylepis.1
MRRVALVVGGRRTRKALAKALDGRDACQLRLGHRRADRGRLWWLLGDRLPTRSDALRWCTRHGRTCGRACLRAFQVRGRLVRGAVDLSRRGVTQLLLVRFEEHERLAELTSQLHCLLRRQLRARGLVR